MYASVYKIIILYIHVYVYQSYCYLSVDQVIFLIKTMCFCVWMHETCICIASNAWNISLGGGGLEKEKIAFYANLF